jgi:hypothetical protein
LVSAPRSSALTGASTAPRAVASSAEWLYPLRLSGADGNTIQVIARAVDEAGNVGASTEPIAVIVDNTGPVITGAQTDNQLQGSVSDGSGVASVEVSLDGGAHYRTALLTAGSWSYDMGDWVGDPQQSFVLLRAHDVWGNVGHAVIVIDSGSGKLIYLPIVIRH